MEAALSFETLVMSDSSEWKGGSYFYTVKMEADFSETWFRYMHLRNYTALHPRRQQFSRASFKTYQHYVDMM